MKKILLITITLSIIITMIFSACKKDNEEEGDTSAVLGVVGVDFTVKESQILVRENIAGNMVCDAYKAYAISKGHNIDLALCNGGALRCNASRPDSLYKSGNFTENMLKEFLVFDMTLVIVEMTGEELLSTFERGVADLPKKAYWFMNVSKEVKLVVKISNTAQIVNTTNNTITTEGTRITSAKINNIDINPLSTYKVAIHNYIANGGDFYIAFKNIPANKKVDLGDYREAMRYYLKTVGTLNPAIEQRITVNN